MKTICWQHIKNLEVSDQNLDQDQVFFVYTYFTQKNPYILVKRLVLSCSFILYLYDAVFCIKI
jgi:hypothetical protein